MKETEHFSPRMGYDDMTKVAGINFSGLSFLPGGVHNCADTQTSARNQGSVPVIEIPINLDGVAEIAKPQTHDAHNVNTNPEEIIHALSKRFPATNCR